MAVGDVYKLDLLMNWVGTDTIACRNTFFYQLLNPVADVAERAFEGFEEDVLPELVLLAPEHIHFTQIDVVNVKTPTDFFTTSLGSLFGSRVTDPVSQAAPSFLALQFVGNRAGPGTRNARKRFPFLYEGDINGNSVESGLLSSAVVTNVATVMAQNISFASIVFTPVVIKHPVSLGDIPEVRFVIDVYTAQLRVSTQVTRKS